MYICIHISIYMRGSCLLSSQVQLKKAPPPHPGLSFDRWVLYAYICAGFGLSDERDLVCVMCGIQSVLCAVFSVCYVHSLVSVI